MCRFGMYQCSVSVHILTFICRPLCASQIPIEEPVSIVEFAFFFFFFFFFFLLNYMYIVALMPCILLSFSLCRSDPAWKACFWVCGFMCVRLSLYVLCYVKPHVYRCLSYLTSIFCSHCTQGPMWLSEWICVRLSRFIVESLLIILSIDTWFSLCRSDPAWKARFGEAKQKWNCSSKAKPLWQKSKRSTNRCLGPSSKLKWYEREIYR